ncbi:MAG: hypothetical protein ACT6FD_03595 [Methanosarcinaceae archaeon]
MVTNVACDFFSVIDSGNKCNISCQKRDTIFHNSGIFGVPLIKKRNFSLDKLKALLPNSCLDDKTTKGIYLRFDDGN